ncbi:MAG: hypothetical protein M0P36_10190 [Bacteroidales bacterium]|nr:hypothetical protein [Bacteroidales bacterium]MDY0314601.1 hypothetical protein [Bacteroidales bacterium]
MNRIKLFLGILFVSSYFIGFSQSVGISENFITPYESSILEVRSANKGVLIPRVALTGISDQTTILSPANSLLVYNTNSAGIAPNNVTPGYYYWNSTTNKWIKMGSGIDDEYWKLTGNVNTNPGSHFIGTTDSHALVFKTNNTERMRITHDGKVGIGTDSPWGALQLSNGRFVIENEADYVGPGSTAYKDNAWVYLSSKKTPTANQGGNIIFSAMQNNSTPADICMIEGVRENATINNTASKLVFYTRPASASFLRRMIIDSKGHITFKPENVSNKDIIINDLGVGGGGSEPTIVPSANSYGFLGTDARAWWRGYAQTFVSTSSKKWKTNIENIPLDEKHNMIQDFKNLNVVSYNPTREITDTLGNVLDIEIMPKTFGLISEDSPKYIVDESGNGIKLYEYISLLTISLQESLDRIKELEEKVKKLEKE